MFNVAHVGYRVILGQAADLHKELLKRKDVGSFFFVERLIDTAARAEKNTFVFLKIPRDPFIDRADRFLAERLFEGPYNRQLNNFYTRHCKKYNIDIIHAHFGMAGAKLEQLKKATGLPLCTTFYGVDASQCLRSDYWLPRMQKLFSYGDRFIVLSEAVRDRLMEKGCDPKKIRVWNCLVDFGYPYNPRRYDGQVVRLITAARFVEKKGYPFLLSVIEQLIRKGVSISLTVVGYGKEKDRIGERIRQLNLEKSVTMIDTAQIPNFTSFYNGLLKEHHIFVLTSGVSKKGDDEGGPALSLVAAQAAGLPVVCTPFVGSERSVVDGHTGFIAQEDVTKFAAKLEDVARHSEIWDAIGEKASSYVRKEFSIEGQTEKMIDIYNEMLLKR